jgi:hypothetical protein
VSGPLLLPAVLLAAGYVVLGVLAAALYLRFRGHGTMPATAPGRPGTGAPPLEVTDPELIAVLAAAATVALGRRVQVHRAHIHRERATELWSRAGRMDIMVSHRMEPRR